MRPAAAFAALALAAGLTGVAAAETPGGFDVLRYDVALDVDPSSRTIAGRTDILLRSERDGLSEVSFSDNALTLSAVTVDGRHSLVSRSGGRIRVRLDRPLASGRPVRMRFTHAGSPPERGVTWGEGSVFTSYFACDWMICDQERFGDKAAIELRLTTSAGLVTIGPGRLAQRRRRGAEAVHVWRETRAYPAFTFAFAAGPYRTWTTRTDRVRLDVVGAMDEAELARRFAPTADMLRWLEAKAGVPFPHARYTQLLVEGGAAQEAVSHAVIGRRMVDPILETPEEDWVIAHELAHQWWGNLVTARDLDHFWLNEGLTTFMVAAWKEHRWGRAAYTRELNLARATVARAAAAGLDVPLSHPGPRSSLRLRRAIQYDKGALFLDALRTELGEAAFWAGLKLYTRRHAGGSVVSRDAQAAWEAASGRDLSRLLDAWVHTSAPGASVAAHQTAPSKLAWMCSSAVSRRWRSAIAAATRSRSKGSRVHTNRSATAATSPSGVAATPMLNC